MKKLQHTTIEDHATFTKYIPHTAAADHLERRQTSKDFNRDIKWYGSS